MSKLDFSFLLFLGSQKLLEPRGGATCTLSNRSGLAMYHNISKQL